MNDKVADLLFEYMKAILFYPERTLDFSELPQEFEKVGEGLAYFAQCVTENKIFISALSKGNLFVDPPKVSNPIAAPAKALQGSLKHLAWQTGQIAKGDYHQRVEFMGDFSHSFNAMVEQLAERTKKLEAEKKIVEEKNLELINMQELFLMLMYNSPELIVLLDLESNEEYIINRAAELMKARHPSLTKILRRELWLHSQSYHNNKSRWDLSFTASDDGFPPKSKSVFYVVDSYPMYWKGNMAMAHIIRDCTEEREKERKLMFEAFNDPMTGLYNRRYAMELLKTWHDEGCRYCISIVDVDYLKYCNDAFGHATGDEYLMNITKVLLMMPEGNVVCRIGGDEFLICAKNVSKELQNMRLQRLRLKMMRGELTEPFFFTQSFSFGSGSRIVDEGNSLSELLRQADVSMYQYKMNFKPKLNTLMTYKDERVED